jgi:hypothetical protein
MMRGTVPSPSIGENSWGRIEVEGVGAFKDVKLWPGGAREWDWDETGTRHEPGIQPSDVEELLAYGPEVVVLSRGRELRLQTCAETFALLAKHGTDVVHDETSAAILAYNRLVAEGRPVAAVIHSTC